jgi:DNA-binding winged helix-turn-helix (wHTH) protein/tetratricopeptide (TPR) repeat protein
MKPSGRICLSVKMGGALPPDAGGPAAGRLRFADFELRLDTCELFRAGRPVRLQQRPAQLLALLARHAGEPVSREEIRRQVWGDRSFVDLEQALNFSVRQLRLALGDSATEPRFVATVPRYGYRFLAAVRMEAAGVSAASAQPPIGRARRRAALGAAAVLLATAVPGAWLAGRRPAAGPAAHEIGPGAERMRGNPFPGADGRAGEPSSGRAAVPRAAYQAYLDGFYLAHAGLPKDRSAALAALERATAMAPRFAAAFGALAMARLDLAQPAARVAPGVEEAARRGLAIDPDDVEARVALGLLALSFHYDLPRAGRELGRAVAAVPDSGEAQLGYAFYLAAAGRHDEAIAAAERAQRLDPLSPAVKGDLAWFYYLARRYDQSIEEARHALVADPQDVQARLYWALSAAMQNDPATALAQVQAFAAADATLAGEPPPPPRFAALGDFWRWRLARLDARNRRGEISPGYFAMAHLGLGDRGRALAELQQACDRHFCPQLPLVLHDPRMDELRDDPRFARLLRCAGVVAG